jgi:hypothetical protein
MSRYDPVKIAWEYRLAMLADAKHLEEKADRRCSKAAKLHDSALELYAEASNIKYEADRHLEEAIFEMYGSGAIFKYDEKGLVVTINVDFPAKEESL